MPPVRSISTAHWLEGTTLYTGCPILIQIYYKTFVKGMLKRFAHISYMARGTLYGWLIFRMSWIMKLYFLIIFAISKINLWFQLESCWVPSKNTISVNPRTTSSTQEMRGCT